jgi:hypothetical protein
VPCSRSSLRRYFAVLGWGRGPVVSAGPAVRGRRAGCLAPIGRSRADRHRDRACRAPRDNRIVGTRGSDELGRLIRVDGGDQALRLTVKGTARCQLLIRPTRIPSLGQASDHLLRCSPGGGG